MIALPWGLIARAVAAAVVLSGMWLSGYYAADRAHLAKQAQALQESIALRDKHAAEVAHIDRTYTAALEAARNENQALAAAVAAGTKRLRVAASCPVPAGQPASVGDAAGPELNAAARPTYYALRDGLARQAEQLAACQALLKTVSPLTE